MGFQNVVILLKEYACFPFGVNCIESCSDDPRQGGGIGKQERIVQASAASIYSGSAVGSADPRSDAQSKTAAEHH